ncbi:MAG: hypothetical protein JOZ38_06645 [Candidatus Eremiobacteraeota bacterium]|nr:hypothetical protein [Candidatus Eremiobacteraeota bacterium]
MANLKSVTGAAILSLAMFAAGAAFTGSASARSETGSAWNIVQVQSRLGNLVYQLDQDNHDYGGHRVAAIADLRAAQAQLQYALDYDATHPH